MTINLHQHHRVNWLDCSRRRLHQKPVASETEGANEATFITEVASEDEHGIRWSEAPRRRGLQPSGHHSYPTPYTVTADIGRSLTGHTTAISSVPLSFYLPYILTIAFNIYVFCTYTTCISPFMTSHD